MYKVASLLIMAALIVNIFNLVNSMLVRQFKSHESTRKHSSKTAEEHAKDLARPPVYHQLLKPEFVDRFDEIVVVGDVHGCYDEMIELIEQVEASKSRSDARILKIFVGDLVNKGPKNLEVIDYMMAHREDCISVRGNHEEIAIKISMVVRSNGKLKKNMAKYEWAKELTDEQLNFLIQLPYTIRFNVTSNQTVIIVHAGLVAGLPLEKHDPYDLVHMRNIVFEDYYDGEGIKPVKSNAVGSPWAPNWPGPEHVYFGHNSKLGFQQCEHATGLDTGCVKGLFLTGIFIKGPRSGTVVKIPSKEKYKMKQSSEEAPFEDLVELDAVVSDLKRNSDANNLPSLS